MPGAKKWAFTCCLQAPAWFWRKGFMKPGQSHVPALVLSPASCSKPDVHNDIIDLHNSIINLHNGITATCTLPAASVFSFLWCFPNICPWVIHGSAWLLIVVHIWTCPLLADCLGKWYLFISLEHPAITQQQCYRCCSENKHAPVSNLYSCLMQ